MPKRPGARRVRDAPDLDPDSFAGSFETEEAGELVMIRGYVGYSPEGSDSVRIYRNLQLDSYWEVKRQDVIRRQRLESEAEPLAGSVLWVKKEAEVEFRQIQTGSMRADFLRGALNPGGPQSGQEFGFTGGGAVPTGLVCVTTAIITFTIFGAPTGGENSDKCCNTGDCSATSKCLCSGGGQSGNTCNVC